MRYWPLCCILLFWGCEFFKPKDFATEKPVAKTGDDVLYPSDLDGLFPLNISDEDSMRLAEKYVEDWVKKQLLINVAAQEIDYNEAEIERKVLDYRYALIVYAYQKKYIDRNLDLTVSEEDIEAYYQERSDNFLLKQSIIKTVFAQVPKTAPDLNQLRRNFKAYPETNVDEFKNYLAQFGVKVFLEDTTWVIFDEVILGTPLETLQNKNQFLESNSYSETSDNDYFYFLKIFDYKISDQVSPLEFIREDIENILINKRKIALKKELEENIYEEAKKNKLFEIYRD